MVQPPIRSYRDLQALLNSVPELWGPPMAPETDFTQYHEVPQNIPANKKVSPFGWFAGAGSAVGAVGADPTAGGGGWPDADGNGIPDPVNNGGHLLSDGSTNILYADHPFWNDLAAFGGSAAVAGGGIESGLNRQAPGLIREQQIRAQEMGWPTEPGTYAPLIGFANANSYGPGALTADQLLYATDGTNPGILNTPSAEYIRPETTASSSVRSETTWLGDRTVKPVLGKILPAFNWAENKADAWSGNTMHDIANGGDGGLGTWSLTYDPASTVAKVIETFNPRIDREYAVARTVWARDPANTAAINQAFENGVQYQLDTSGKLTLVILNDVTRAVPNLPTFTGGEAVNELFEYQQNLPLIASLIRDTFDDPSFWITLGSSGISGVLKASARAAALSGDVAAARRFGIAAKVVGAPAALDDATFKPITWPLGQAAQGLRTVGWSAADNLGIVSKLARTSSRSEKVIAGEVAGEVRNAASDLGEAPGMRDMPAGSGTVGDLPEDPVIRPEEEPTFSDPATIPDPLPADPAPDIEGMTLAPEPALITPAGPEGGDAASTLLQRVRNGLPTRATYSGSGAVKESPAVGWMETLAREEPAAWAQIAADLEEVVNDLQRVLTEVERQPLRKVDRQFALQKYMVLFKQAMQRAGLDPNRFAINGHSGFFRKLSVQTGRMGDQLADTFSREGMVEVLLHADPDSTWYATARNWMIARGDIRLMPVGGTMRVNAAGVKEIVLPTPEALAAYRAQLRTDILNADVYRIIGGIRENGLVISGGDPDFNVAWKALLAPYDQGSKTFLAGLATTVYRSADHLGKRVPGAVGVKFDNTALATIRSATLRTVDGQLVPGEQFLTAMAEVSLRQKDEAYAFWKRIQHARSLDNAVSASQAAPEAAAAPSPNGAAPEADFVAETDGTLRRPAEAAPPPPDGTVPPPAPAPRRWPAVNVEALGRELRNFLKFGKPRANKGKTVLRFLDPIDQMIYSAAKAGPKAKSYPFVLQYLRDEVGLSDEQIAAMGKALRQHVTDNANGAVYDVPPISRTVPDPPAAAAPSPNGSVPPPPSGTIPPSPDGSVPPPPDRSAPPAPAPEPTVPTWTPRDLNAAAEAGDLSDAQRELLETPVDTGIIRARFGTKTVNVEGVNIKVNRVMDEIEQAGTARTAIDLYDHLLYLLKDPEVAQEYLAEALFAARLGTARYTRYTARQESRHIALRALRGYDKMLSFMRRKMQFNLATGPAAMNQDLLSTNLTVASAGRLGAMTRFAELYPKGWKNAVFNMATIEDFAQESIHEAVGLRMPGYIKHGLDRAQSGEILGNRTYLINQWWWKGGTGVVESETIKKLRSYHDNLIRMALEEDYLLDGIAAARHKVLLEIRAVAEKRGLDATALVQQLDAELPHLFKPADLDAAVSRVLDAGQGTHFKRRWTNEMYTAARVAKNQQEKLLFTYRMTNADEILSRVLFFHYWSSRALVTYSRLAMTNWPLMAFYLRTWDTLKLKAEKEGYPPEFQSYIRYMADADGLVGYLDAISLGTAFSVFEQLAIDNGNEPAWQRALESAFMVNPIIGAALTVIGADEIGGVTLTFGTPNLLGVRSATSAGTIVANWVNAHTGFHVDDAVIGNAEERLFRRATEAANAGLRKWLPMLPKTDLYDPEQADLIKIKSLLVHDYEQQYGPIADWSAEVQAQYAVSEETLLHGGEDAMARAAIERYWDQRVKFQAVRTFVPATRVRSMPLDQAKQDKASTDSAIRQAGYDTSSLIYASPEATALNADLDGYKAIGTDRQRTLAEGYAAISNGNLPGGQMLIEINGVMWSAGLLSQQADKDRTSLAWLWVQEQAGENELKDYWAERDAYKTSRPMLEQYDAYWASKDVYPDEAAWRAGLAKRSPAFAAALATQEQFLRDKYPAMSPSVFEQRMQGWMARDGYLAWLGYTDSLTADPLPATGGGSLPVPEDTPAAKGPSEDESAYQAELDRIKYAYYNLDDQITAAEKQLKERRARGELIRGEPIRPTPDFWTLTDPLAISYWREVLGKDYPTANAMLRNYWAWAAREKAAGRPYSMEAFATALTRDNPFPGTTSP